MKFIAWSVIEEKITIKFETLAVQYNYLTGCENLLAIVPLQAVKIYESRQQQMAIFNIQ